MHYLSGNRIDLTYTTNGPAGDWINLTSSSRSQLVAGNRINLVRYRTATLSRVHTTDNPSGDGVNFISHLISVRAEGAQFLSLAACTA